MGFLDRILNKISSGTSTYAIEKTSTQADRQNASVVRTLFDLFRFLLYVCLYVLPLFSTSFFVVVVVVVVVVIVVVVIVVVFPLSTVPRRFQLQISADTLIERLMKHDDI